ncbi:MAG TPA: phosphoglycerate mutase family protein [Thermoanaerobaculia bacterium]|nr:phosphoglycerate mutase family protein [Thermoanaerobaculia bacterium]
MAVFCAFWLVAPRALAALDAIYLVRHAEKAEGWPEADKALDPFWPLSPAGIARARALGPRFAGAGLAAVYASRTVRAFATGLPVAEAAGAPLVVDPASTVKPEMDAFLARLRQRHPADRAVFVVGHSNTIPELLRRLGATQDCFARLGIKATEKGGLEIEGYDGLWKVELAKPGCAGMTRQASSPQATP